jgi:hypothetical protein
MGASSSSAPSLRHDSEFESNDGFNTYIWGPVLWHVLHTISFNYKMNPTRDDQVHYYTFIRSLEHVLPCKSCRENFMSNLIKVNFPITDDPEEIANIPQLKDRHAFSRFVYDLHTAVCKMKDGETGLKCTYYAMRETYECFRAKCNPKTATHHGGCELPIKYVPSKAVIRVVPKHNSKHIPSFSVDNGCQAAHVAPVVIKKK